MDPRAHPLSWALECHQRQLRYHNASMRPFAEEEARTAALARPGVVIGGGYNLSAPRRGGGRSGQPPTLHHSSSEGQMQAALQVWTGCSRMCVCACVRDACHPASQGGSQLSADGSKPSSLFRPSDSEEHAHWSVWDVLHLQASNEQGPSSVMFDASDFPAVSGESGGLGGQFGRWSGIGRRFHVTGSAGF
eukprot:scaffold173086_cov18-Tisochrysis_lutea.AAC.1